MTQVERDALALRCEALERRVDDVGRRVSVAQLATYIVAGIVVAAMIVGAVELRAAYQIMEAQAWRSR